MTYWIIKPIGKNERAILMESRNQFFYDDEFQYILTSVSVWKLKFVKFLKIHTNYLDLRCSNL